MSDTLLPIVGTFYLDYEQDGQRHTAASHAQSANSIAEVDSTWQTIFTALGAFLITTTIVGFRWRAAGSQFSTPVGSFLQGSVFGDGNNTTYLTTLTALNFVGRSTSTGTKTRVGLFGFKAPSETDLRLASSQAAYVNSIVGALNDAETSFLARDGTRANWYPYANISLNAYYQRKRRIG